MIMTKNVCYYGRIYSCCQHIFNCLAPVDGIEPPLRVLETPVLPLHHTGFCLASALFFTWHRRTSMEHLTMKILFTRATCAFQFIAGRPPLLREYLIIWWDHLDSNQKPTNSSLCDFRHSLDFLFTVAHRALGGCRQVSTPSPSGLARDCHITDSDVGFPEFDTIHTSDFSTWCTLR